MKMLRHLIILLTLFLALLGSGLNGFGQTHIYITGSDTNGSANFPNPPSGTPDANIVGSFYAAVERANAVVGNYIIHLRTNTLYESQRCNDIQEGVNIQVINDTPQRKGIRWLPAAYKTSHRMVGVRGTLTLGGEGCTSTLIFRCQEGWAYYYPSEVADDGTDARVLLKVEGNGVVNIQENCELSYGKVNVWLASPNATLNQSGGVICSAGDMNVNITQGTFNMMGGYIVGHYFSTGNTIPTYSGDQNKILDRDNFLAAKFTKNGTMDYHLDTDDVKNVIQNYYPLDAADSKDKLNNAIAVYIHDSKDNNGNHLAKFNMSGGYICGFYAHDNTKVIVGGNGTTLTYAEDANHHERTVQRQPVYNNGGEFTMTGGSIYANHSNQAGIIRLTHWDFVSNDPDETFDHTLMTMTGGDISYCSAGNGGGMRVELGATFNMSGGKLSHCVANAKEAVGGGTGGIRMVSAKFVMSGTAEVEWCSSYTNSKAQSGGGIGAVWQTGFGNVATVIELNGGRIHHNYSRGYGGGVAATDKGNTNVVGGVSVTVNGCEIDNNSAGIDGGGVFVGGNTTVEVKGNSKIHNNAATGNGGGLLISTEAVTAPCSLDVASSEIYGNTAANGAGAYVHQGTFNLQNGAYIHDNDATTYGGGVYMDGGAFNHYGGEIGKQYGTNGATANTAQDGAGVYMNDGTYTMSGGFNRGNKATRNGGGVYMAGGTFNLSAGSIGLGSGNYRNTATDGAGVYMANGGTFNMTGGSIRGNYASGNGGGVYMATGELHVSGTAMMTGNNAASGEGGGVYQNGTMTVDGTQLRITGNTAGSPTQTANNIYLPNTKTIEVGSSVNAASVELGITTESIATVGTDIPVLTTVSGNEQKLVDIRDAFLDGTSRIADDRRVHKAKYPGAAALTLYFTKYNFDYDAFTTDFQNPIDSRIQLYKFMCWVNGVNGFSSTHPNAVGIVTADIEMNHITQWIPIGSVTPFTGKLLSKASYNSSAPESAPDAMHVISNLYIDASSGYANKGLFGVTEGATISGVIMEDCDFNISTGGSNIGSIIGLMKGGVLMNCGGSGTLTSTSTGCPMGGLVGRVEKTDGTAGTSGLIHSCYSTLHLNGYEMGGLVGQMATGTNLYNSFANAKFDYQGGSKYFGGLVGVNTGHVENCYARIQNTSNPSSNYFGWIAGQNNSGTITYCYIPTTNYGATYVKNGTAADNKCTSFGSTSTPYQYKHADNQMTANSNNGNIVNGAFDRNGLKGLLATLNKWVGSSDTYSKWMRTSASPINDDYPVFDFPEVCLVSKNNVDMFYSNDFNNKFERLLAANWGAGTGTIYIYNSPNEAIASTLSNNNKATELYIHEDVVLMHSSILKAHVGITLDNSAGTEGATPSFGGEDAIDWHFFSSALADAPIGLTYGNQSQYNLGVYPSWHATFTNANGYFPTNLNDVVDGDDYYEHWDLYGYYEPDYHWVNYKRNSASHWHEDYPGINIPYDNDTEFEPGKGYMVALKEEGYLQAYGTLNTHTTDNPLRVDLSYTPSIGWTTREGHNLLGNPYQSYLDFNEFAKYNMPLWKDNDIRNANYIIIDEVQKDYVQYAYGSSENPFGAGRYLHPHQGFMVIVGQTGLKANFDDRMRNVTATSGFRDEQPRYPLVNLFATDGNGNRDMVTVELGRPDKGGAPKQQALRTSSCSLWCRYEDEDYALVFTQPGLEYANIRFAADEDAEFTMTWSTHNGEFSYLHLIDNLTGADIDCLTASEYRFSARESDYNSRFRLVFDYTGINDHEATEPVEGSATFAYYANGEIHLMATPDATAQLQIIDMTGRVIVSRDGVHTVSTTGLAAGVYVLRLTTANGTRTQKIILN